MTTNSTKLTSLVTLHNEFFFWVSVWPLDYFDSIAHWLTDQVNELEIWLFFHKKKDYFDSNAHWLTDEQKKDAAAKEKEFLDRLNRRRRDVQGKLNH